MIRWHSRGSRTPAPPDRAASLHDRVPALPDRAAGRHDWVPAPPDRAAGLHDRSPETPDRAAGPDDELRPGTPVWLHLPERGVRLPAPAVLLHLLATAAAAARLGPHLLTLDDGVLAVPALGAAPVPVGPPSLIPPRGAFGFGTPPRTTAGKRF